MLSPRARLLLLLAVDSSRKQIVMGLCQDSVSNLNDQIISSLCREEKGKIVNCKPKPMPLWWHCWQCIGAAHLQSAAAALSWLDTLAVRIGLNSVIQPLQPAASDGFDVNETGNHRFP